MMNKNSKVGTAVPSYKQELGTRIKAVCDLVGGVRPLSKRCGIHEVQLHKYIAGQNLPSIKVICAIAEATEVSLEWLATGKGPMKIEEDRNPKEWRGKVTRPLREVGDTEERLDPEQYYYVPMVDVHLAAGYGAFVHSEQMLDYYAFRKDWLHKVTLDPKQVVLMQIIGNSMEPTLRHGDTVMVDLLRRTIYDGCLYAIRIDEVVLIKTLQSLPGGEIKLISKNKAEYPPIQAPKDDIHIIGQIIWLARELSP